ncbi:MAG: hypothetical protein AAF664_09725 [Planctomycetota bacterium]
MHRRDWVGFASVTAALSLNRLCVSSEPISDQSHRVNTRMITRPPGNHWFGYYDKFEFSPDDELVLSNRVDFEHRAPTGDDSIEVGFVDTADSDRWHSIGRSRSWGWQQGCMLQFIGETGRRVMYNDRDQDRFVCRLVDLDSGQRQTIGRPVYTLSPDGRYGLSVDFSRLDALRPGYGYDGLSSQLIHDRAPEDDGVWRVDMSTGQSQLIFSYADAAQMPWLNQEGQSSVPDTAWHYFNHLLTNPSGDRFIVLHRYRPKFDPKTLRYEGNFVTRMLTIGMDGSDPYVLDGSGRTSHFIWRDDEAVEMWTRVGKSPDRFYCMYDQSNMIEPLGHDVMTLNGHNTRLPKPYNDFILNDTYPSKDGRLQTVYLYHVPTGTRLDLGAFHSPSQYRGEWRCDTHPRSSRSGRFVAIDSPHATVAKPTAGRQVHLLDIGEVLDAFT